MSEEQRIASLEQQLSAAKAEREKQLAAVAEHRNQKLDDLCWEDDNRLYVACGLEPRDPVTCDKEKMLANCARYIDRRCKPNSKWKSYQELEEERDKLAADWARLRMLLLPFVDLRQISSRCPWCGWEKEHQPSCRLIAYVDNAAAPEASP